MAVLQKIKIIHIITRLDMGGSAQNTLQTCLRLDRDKYDIILVYGPSLESNMTDEEALSVQRWIEYGKKRVFVLSVFFPWFAGLIL